MTTWKTFIYELIENHCEKNDLGTFTLQDFISKHARDIQEFRPENRNWEAKVRQQLQFLRDDNLLHFADNHGTYTLKNFLTHDKLDDENIETTLVSVPEKHEYLVETFARNRKYVTLALNRFGSSCLCEGCENKFTKPDGFQYIEVHHVIPLCDGGEDALWNLSVLCAHHHRMAHFADCDTKLKLKNFLLKKIDSFLQN